MSLKIILLIMVLIHSSFSVLACPLCDSERAEQIREAIFGADFFMNIGMILLPFIIFLIITLLICYGKLKLVHRIAFLNSNKGKHE